MIKTIPRLRLSPPANTRMIPSMTGQDNPILTMIRARANLTIFGASTGFFCTVGFLNSFGVFEAYYMDAQLAGESESTIAWIGAISIFFIFAVSVVSGPLLDLFGPGVSITFNTPLYTRAELTRTVDAICRCFGNRVFHHDDLALQGNLPVYPRTGSPAGHIHGTPSLSNACPRRPAYQSQTWRRHGFSPWWLFSRRSRVADCYQ